MVGGGVMNALNGQEGAGWLPWMGGRVGWAMRAGGKPKGGCTFHLDTDSSAVHPAVNINSHNAQQRPRWLLAAVCHFI